MYLAEAIKEADRLKPNSYSESEKVKWLSNLDGIVFEEIICRHLDKDGNPVTESFAGYDEDTDINCTELLVTHPYNSVYLYWLKMQMDYNNEEFTKYNNDKTLFNMAYLALTDYYNRNYMPNHTTYAASFKL